LEDSSFITEILQVRPQEYFDLPEKLKSNVGYAVIVAKEKYQSLSDDLKADVTVALSYIEDPTSRFTNLPDSLIQNDEMFLAYLKSRNDVSSYELNDALENKFGDNYVLPLTFVEKCLRVRLDFVTVLTSKNFDLGDWKQVLQQFPIADLVEMETFLEIAHPLISEYSSLELWDRFAREFAEQLESMYDLFERLQEIHKKINELAGKDEPLEATEMKNTFERNLIQDALDGYQDL
jgi:hypothetical protein